MDTLRSNRFNSCKRSALFSRFSYKFLATLVLVSLLIPLSAFGLTIDEFDEDGEVSSNVVGTPATDNVSGAAIGGNRHMYTVKTSGFLKSELATSGGALYHTNQAGTGVSRVTWDGDDLEDFTPTGLGGIDLTHDGTGDENEDGIIVYVFLLDDSTPVTLKITAFSNDTKVSYLEKTLSNPINWPEITEEDGVPIKFLFKDFKRLGGQAADFTDIGALQLEINQNTVATDLIINRVVTNGCNDEVPDASTDSKDRCGVVCGTDACVDCFDVPNGPALPGTSCDTGLDGICADGTWEGPVPSCTCKQNEDPVNEICDGLDNNCDGETDEPFDNLGDACSVGEDDCAINGVFECNDQGGVRCTADDRKDEAEECDNSRGCDGVPYSGLVFDDCGVCGGDSKSCADCEGVPNGGKEIDRCGICDGDGQSCVNCDNNNIEDLQRNIDGTTRQIAKYSKNLRNQIIKEAKAAFLAGKISKRERRARVRFARTTYKDQNALADEGWEYIWTEVPSQFSTCSNSFCVSTSNAGPINGFLAINDQMLVNNEAMSNELRELGLATGSKSARRRATRLKKRSRNKATQNEVNADSIPLTVSNCS